jgi:hypothetical protein
MTEADLFVAARRAYETGRVRRAAWRAAGVAPLTVVPIAQCAALGRAGEAFVGAAAVVVLVALFLWRGQGYGRGAGVGLVAGLAPLLLPSLATATGVLCSATVCGVLPLAAVAGGLVAGLVLGGRSLAGAAAGPPFWFAATAVTGCLGAMGCLHVGIVGLAGMALGVVAGAAPVLYWRAARSAS